MLDETFQPLTAAERSELAQLEHEASEEGGILTPAEAFTLATLRNRRDGRSRWDVGELYNGDCYLTDTEEDDRLDATGEPPL